MFLRNFLRLTLTYGFVFFFISSTLSGQKLHTPEEITSLMRTSLMKYESLLLADLSYTLDLPVLKDVILLKSADSTQLKTYKPPVTKGYLKQLKKGNKYLYKKNKYDKARKYFLKALLMDSKNAPLIKLIGDSYLMEKKLDKAKTWYNKAIDVNVAYIEAQEALASVYFQQKKLSEAIQIITIAHLRNRNSKETLQILKRIYQEWGKPYNDSWSFQPKMTIQQTGSDQTTITATTTPWLYYGNCKAYWKAEKGYQKAMQNDFGGDIHMVEEKECLLNWLIGYEYLETEEEKEAHAVVQRFLKTMEAKQEKEFILYEIWLVNNPKLIYKLDHNTIEQLISYITTYRIN